MYEIKIKNDCFIDEAHAQQEKSKSEFDPGTKSEGEEDSQSGAATSKKGLGKTPNHLTLSTTSTLSAGSTGSQAKLIQSSHHPENYQPSQVKDLGEYENNKTVFCLKLSSKLLPFT